MNLLLNAIQAMPGGGAITISVAADRPDFVRFDVRDTGMGMEPETMEHIFEPFFTTKSAGPRDGPRTGSHLFHRKEARGPDRGGKRSRRRDCFQDIAADCPHRGCNRPAGGKELRD